MTFGDARLVIIVLALAGLGACQDLTPVPPAEAGPDDATADDGGDETGDDSSSDAADDTTDAGTE